MDILEISEEDWEDLNEVWMSTVIVSKDKLIQLKFFHGIYYTPAKLNKLGLSSSSICFRLCGREADFVFGPVLNFKVFGER